jgi:hypothetical protein
MAAFRFPFGNPKASEKANLSKGFRIPPVVAR